AGWTPGAEREHTTPIYATSSYVFDSAAQAAARFSGEEPGNIYSRFTNPTVQVFERRLAALEEGEACVATASGMAAILATCMALLKCGDHIVSSRTLFGSSISLFENYLKPFGIEVTYVDPGNTQAWQDALQDNTRMLFVETPSNPLTELADIRALASIADAADALLVVDNCFCTPVLQKPLTQGAHIVVHSSTKYLDGQGRCIGGAVIGDAKTVGEKVFAFIRTAGPSLSPFNAWVFLKALETLDLRVKAHCASARQLAEWLQGQDAIERVYYPGLKSHPQHQLACAQQKDFGGIVSFDVKGGREAAWRLIDSTSMISITANLGDTRTTITHPATTTHGRISAEARERAGIGEGLIRISVGLENIEDIIADLRSGLA
ncbi:MAG: O-succinylhomoserine sulfhydrylase, partial [Nevskiales bacterium]